MDLFLFAVAALIAVVAAALVVLQRNPIYSALYLIITLFCLALLYLQLHAQFLAIMQVVVYAGAIMVLFLFVIMLLNQDKPFETVGALRYQNPVAAVMGLLLFLELVCMAVRAKAPTLFGFASPEALAVQDASAKLGTVETIATSMFTTYLFPFELASVLLLVGMIGVVVLAKRKV